MHPLDPNTGFKCKFPGCGKGFYRGDNLLPHYLTHVTSQHDKRSSKNTKVEFVELEKIIGPMHEIKNFYIRLTELYHKKCSKPKRGT
jgi:uncharacterized Zn-finger protein